jgi:hypothetical protein
MTKNEQISRPHATTRNGPRARGGNKSALAGFLSVALTVILLSAPTVARAEFTLIDRAEAWFFYMQRGVGRSYAACQIVSCVRGVCGAGGTARTQFSLYDARDGHGVMPEFVAPNRVAPGAFATLFVNGDRFELHNRFSSPQYYLQAENGSAARIVDALLALEAQDGLARFVVLDPQGREHAFTVRGVTESLDRMERRCTRRY